ncbi:MAG: translocation/assembly module TamB domain-containing protein [Acidobacteria bacterium]|nr:translocation/assembly module TamB domain-containing protein [Acidobacteriota bacterium]
MNRRPSEQTAAPLPKLSHRRWSRPKRVLVAFGILALLIGLFLFGGWLYLRSERFNRFAVEEIKSSLRNYGLRAEVGGTEISLQDQTARLRDFKLFNDQTGQPIVSIKTVELSVLVREPYALRLNREIELQKLNLKGVDLYVEVDQNNRTNFEGIRQPPQKSQRITIDSSKLIATLNGGTIHLRDHTRQVEANLTGLKIKANPQPQNPGIINLQLSADGGQAVYQKREEHIEKLDLIARLSEAGAEFDQINLSSGFGHVKGKGKLDQWRTPRFGFDFEGQFNLQDVTAFFLPDQTIMGSASAKGRVEGEPDNYRISGDLNLDNALVDKTRVHQGSINRFMINIARDRVEFTGQELRAQSVMIDNLRLAAATINNLKGDFKNKRVQAVAPMANVATIEGPNIRLANLRLNDVLIEMGSDHEQFSYQVKAGANLNEGTISNVNFSGASAQAVFNNSALTLNEIKAELMGGSAAGEFSLALGRQAETRAKADFENLSTKEVFSVAASNSDRKELAEIPISGKVSGESELSFSGTNLKTISGRIKARFAGETGATTDAIPINGAADVTVQNGVFNFEQLKLATDASQLTGSGSVAIDGNSELRLKLTSTQAEQLLQLTRSIDAARPFLADYEPQLIGDFKFDGSLRFSPAPKDSPAQIVIEGDVDAGTIGLRDALLGSLSAHLSISPDHLRVERGSITAANGGSVKFDLALPLDAKSTTGNLNANIDRIELETILAAVGAPDTTQFISGEVKGEAHFTGLPSSVNGNAMVNLVNGKIAGQPAELAMANLKLDGKNALLDRLEFRLPQSHLVANGQMNLSDYTFKAQGKADQLSLQNLSEAFELKETRIEGVADAEFTLGGKVIAGKQPELDWESLQVNLLVNGKAIKINNRKAGELKLTASTSQGGSLEFALASGILAPAKDVPPNVLPELLKGKIELRQPGRPITIESNLADQDLGPILEIFAPDLAQYVKGAVTGKLRIDGPAVDETGKGTMEQMRGNLTLTAMTLEVANTPVKVETPLTIRLETLQVIVDKTRLSGDGLDLNIGGTFGLSGEAGMNFTLNGQIDLNKLPLLASDLLLNGAVSLDTKLTGTADVPNIDGKTLLNGFGISSNEWPVFISDGTGQLTFAGNQIKLENFKANANDGELEINGTTKLSMFRPSEWNYEINVKNAVLNYQEINATLNGRFTLAGTPQGQTLTGKINIPQVEFVPRIDLDNLLTGGAKNLSFSGIGGTGGGSQPSGVAPITLDLRVEGRDSFLVRNNQINAVGSAVMTVTGTLADPRIAGRIETDGGTVRFRGQRYEITTGSIEFTGGTREPRLNLIAESDISGFHVTLGFVGRLNEIELTTQSEPTLTRNEILALITTGRTEAGSLTGQDFLASGVGAAASLVTTGLISKPTEQLLGLSRFSIDPVIRPNEDPAARLTVGQQLSRNLFVSYSTILSSEQDQIALTEYTISNRFSMLASFTQGGTSTTQSATENDFTIELRGRKRFALGYVPPDPLSSLPGSGSSGLLKSIDRPKLPAADTVVDPVPELKLSGKKLRELLPVMTQGFSRSLARLGERKLREYLQERGYFFAEVNFRCEPVNCVPPASPLASNAELRVFYDIEPFAIHELKEIRIEGTEQVKLKNISDQLQSQVASSVGRIPFLRDLPLIGGTVRGITSTERLRNDEETIRGYLVDLGFRDARVTSRFAVKPDNDDLVVIFDVDEGLQSDIAGISMRGNTILSAQTLREALPIQPGEAFSLNRAKTGTQQIERLYAREGFHETTVELNFVNVDKDSVLLQYTINEGPRTVISEIEIRGLNKTGPNWVRRYLDFKPGDVLTPAKIRRTQRDLYTTQAFREVTIRTEPISAEDPSAQRVILDLTEAKPLLLVYGLGFSTDDGPKGLMEITNANLGGTLDSLSLRMRGSRKDQFAQLSFTDLRPFNHQLPTTISVFYNRNTNLEPFIQRKALDADGKVVDADENVDFGIRRFSAFIQTERKFAERTSMRLRYSFETSNTFTTDSAILPDTDLTRNERAIRLGMFTLGFTRDSRDSLLNPTVGQLISADHSLASNIFGGNESFNKFFGNYQRYKTLDSDIPLLGNTTLAFSARIGLAAMFKFADRDRNGIIDDFEQQLPINERFFSGGATTLRGFKFDTAGPQDILEPRPEKSCSVVPPVRPCDLPTLVPTGGDGLVIFNFELRYPLTQRLRLVSFYDLGNVFRRVSDINFSGMTNTVGLGLRINTPLGPVGVDYGYLIDPPFFITKDGAVLRQPSGAIHIRLGQSF